jgi:molybdopterin-guanine dinucleotide biosynthesis protein A
VPDSRPPEFDAIILAGGRGARLGGADKPGLVVGSSTMAATAARAAVAAGARQVILVGPARPDVTAAAGEVTTADVPETAAGAPSAHWLRPASARARLIVTREDPPGSGPVPALRAGLAEAAAPWVAVLAADLPFLRAEELRILLAAAWEGASAGAVIADESGAEQWLAGCWRTGLIRAALASYRGSSLRGLLGPLRPVLVRAVAPAQGPFPWLDCDTPDALAAARTWRAAPELAPRPGPAGHDGPADHDGETDHDGHTDDEQPD